MNESEGDSSLRQCYDAEMEKTYGAWHRLRLVGRRAFVASVVCSTFLLWVAQPTSVRLALLIGGALLVASIVIGTMLSWPRNLFIRSVLVLTFCGLLGLRTLQSLEPREVVVAFLSGLPVAFLFAVVAVVDWFIALAWRKFAARSPQAVQ